MNTCRYCGNGDNHNALCPGKVISDLNNEPAAANAENERLKRLHGLAAEFDAAPSDAGWEPPHPIFQMAQENDDLRAERDKLLAERGEREPMDYDRLRKLGWVPVECPGCGMSALSPVPAVPEWLIEALREWRDDHLSDSQLCDIIDALPAALQNGKEPGK